MLAGSGWSPLGEIIRQAVIQSDPLVDGSTVMEGVVGYLDGKIVGSGTWCYGGGVAKRIVVRAAPARLSRSRYDEDDRLDERTPIPVTPDGFVYHCDPGPEGRTLEEAKALADAEPGGPVTWDVEPTTPAN